VNRRILAWMRSSIPVADVAPASRPVEVNGRGDEKPPPIDLYVRHATREDDRGIKTRDYLGILNYHALAFPKLKVERRRQGFCAA
jgi:hypothetical protein